MRFRSMLAFITLWHLLVYCPVAHSVWAKDGFLSRAGCLLNRKMLSEIAIHDPATFDALVATARKHCSVPHALAA